MPHVLIIDDEANIRRMLAALLRAEGFLVDESPNGPAGLIALETLDPDAIFLDLFMPPGPDGLDTLSHLRSKGIEAPVIMMSGKAQLADAVRAAQLGAFQFLEKPLSPEAVLVTLRAAVELGRTRSQNRALRQALETRDEMVGQSAPLRHVRQLIAQVAPTDARVLITGESGTGKELVASAIHRASRRGKEPFVTVNCAAIPRELVESEMFGHERGAFTGAGERRLGRFELADKGTLFLDEIGDMPLPLQVKLLRVIEAREVRPIGATRAFPIDVRILSATHRDLLREKDNGTFREDLYYRLNVVTLKLPSLDERPEDIVLLADHFLKKLAPRYGRDKAAFAAEALELLVKAKWPGNVRQLYNVVEQSIALCPTEIIPQAFVEQAIQVEMHEMTSFEDARKRFERDYLTRILKLTHGSVTQAARLARRNRTEFYKLLQRHGIEAAVFKSIEAK